MYKIFEFEGLNTPYRIYDDGKIYDEYNKKFLKIYKNNSGYQTVLLYVLNSNNKFLNKFFSVHRLVAQAFIPNPENKPQVNHIDGNKLNNNVDNLEWVTPSENLKHAIDMGLKSVVKGKDVHFAKYSENQVKLACGLIEKDENSLKEIEKMSGIPCKTLSEIRKGLIWKNISCNYNFPKEIYTESKYFDHVTNRKIHELLKANININDILNMLNLENNSKNKKLLYDMKWNMNPDNKNKKLNIYIKYRKSHNKKYCVKK